MLRRSPLRTARAAFTASSSSKPQGRLRSRCCVPALANTEFASAGSVNKAGLVTVRWIGSPVMDQVVHGYCLAGDQQPPSLPLARGFGWLISGEQFVPAERASAVLPGEQAQRGPIHRRFDLSPPLGPVFGQRWVVRRRPALDHDVSDDVSPGKPCQVGAAGGVAEHPAVVPELVEFAEVAGRDPPFRLCWGGCRSPICR